VEDEEQGIWENWKWRGFLLMVGAMLMAFFNAAGSGSEGWYTVAGIIGFVGFGMFVVGRFDD
jgi:hypothetical protein